VIKFVEMEKRLIYLVMMVILSMEMDAHQLVKLNQVGLAAVETHFKQTPV
jgi:hypothetical protein